MSEVNFAARTGDQTLIYTFAMRDGSPIKLGDGTFGAVFRVEGVGNQSYALKIFYETEDETALKRYEEEMAAAEVVRSVLQEQRLEALVGSLVLPTASTKEFKSSPAFTALKNYFNRAQLSISTYGLVTPLYTCTLKELLERGAPAGRLVDAERIDEAGRGGYQILQGLSYPERECYILPFILQIARGLRALHAAQLHHHDLKPANILIKTEGGDLVAAVADLGFLNPNLAAGTTWIRFGEALPLGTRHYRSPEQKDYFDICEVDVQAARPNEPILLTTHDRKFTDTLIERGDIAVFSKDPGKTARKIIDIKHLEGGGAQITLEPQVVECEADVRTQVILYKKHTARTDVFGLGAIIFDLLTCGRSPERFYDLIRPWDQRADRDRSVDTLVERYKQLTKSQTTHPELATTFQPLRHERGGYPSTDIVSILLRCMLTASADSYARQPDKQPQGTSNERLQTFRLIIHDLELVMRRLNAWPWMNDRNPLWVGKVKHDNEPMSEVDFPAKLSEIQKIKSEELGKRLVLAYRLLRKIAEAAEMTERSHEVFLAEFSPNYLRGVGQSDVVMSSIGIIYGTEQDYWTRIENGGNFNVPDDPRDRFVPPGLTFDSRPVLLDATESPADPPSDDAAGDDICYTFRYQDSCPFWRGLERGDVLLINLSDRKRIPRPIVRVDDNQVRVQPAKDGEPLPSGRDLQAIAIKKLNPVDYYLSMIGIYIHQLFFVDGQRDTGALPEAIWLFQQAKACTLVERLTSLEAPHPPKLAKNATGPGALFDYLARLYAWLVCMDYREQAGERHSSEDAPKLFGHVRAALDQLRVLVAQVVEIDPYLLDTMSNDDIEKKEWARSGACQDYSTLNEQLLQLVNDQLRKAKAPPRPGIITRLLRWFEDL
jgi:serine/threonine protein kinase